MDELLETALIGEIMSKHMQGSLSDLKKKLLTMGGMVEEAVERAVQLLREPDVDEADHIITGDRAIDELELEIDDECLKVLALYQPVAEDLRFVSTVMKINNDLERVADLAVNTARRARDLKKPLRPELSEPIQLATKRIIKMLRNGLNAFVERDPITARKVIQADDAIDRYHSKMIKKLISYMTRHPGNIEDGVQLLWVSRNLERIADHITNMGEDIVYMVEGETIRHRKDQTPPGRLTM